MTDKRWRRAASEGFKHGLSPRVYHTAEKRPPSRWALFFLRVASRQIGRRPQTDARLNVMRRWIWAVPIRTLPCCTHKGAKPHPRV